MIIYKRFDVEGTLKISPKGFLPYREPLGQVTVAKATYAEHLSEACMFAWCIFVVRCDSRISGVTLIAATDLVRTDFSMPHNFKDSIRSIDKNI